MRKDRVQRGAEQPRARLGVRFPHVYDQLAYGAPAEHFARLSRLEAGARLVQRGSGVISSRLEAYSYEFSPGDRVLADAAETPLAESRHSDGAETARAAL